ncbi:MAG: SAM-dependent methyltransferase [Nevskia sp.]|nr:SAM-dependent methyltransferase [Nevskia sp.]
MNFAATPPPLPRHLRPVFSTAQALCSLGRALQQHGYAFTTVTPLTQQRVNARAESAQAHDLAGIFGWSRPFTADAVAAPLLALMREAGVVDSEQGILRATLRASALDGQLYFHSAYPTTAADAVFFGPDTSRFVRALRCALAVLEQAPLRAADIGCGAGPAAITIALAHPGAAVYALDINPSALQLTEVNAALAGAGSVRALPSDMLGGVAGLFDLIVSNPPYLLDRERRAYRHGGGALGAGMSLAVVEAAVVRLAPGGKLMLYTGVAIVGNSDPFRAAAAALLQAARFTWTYEEIDPDVFGEELDEPAYAHADRIAAVWLCATAPGAAP